MAVSINEKDEIQHQNACYDDFFFHAKPLSMQILLFIQHFKRRQHLAFQKLQARATTG